METRPAYRSASEMIVDTVIGRTGRGAVLATAIPGAIAGFAMAGPMGGLAGAFATSLPGTLAFYKYLNGEAVDPNSGARFEVKRSFVEKIGNFFFGIENDMRAPIIGAALSVAGLGFYLGPIGAAIGGAASGGVVASAVGGGLAGYLLHKKSYIGNTTKA
jgi:hypothetical protein